MGRRVSWPFRTHTHLPRIYLNDYIPLSSGAKTPQQPKPPSREIRTRVPRVRKINFSDEGSVSQNETVSDYRSIDTETSSSIYSNNVDTDGKRGKRKSKKERKRKKNNGKTNEFPSYPFDDELQESIPEEMDPTVIAQEFITILQDGMKLTAATSIGSLRDVIIGTDGVHLTWVSRENYGK